jgi:myomegalin
LPAFLSDTKDRGPPVQSQTWRSAERVPFGQAHSLRAFEKPPLVQTQALRDFEKVRQKYGIRILFKNMIYISEYGSAIIMVTLLRMYAP